MLTKCYQMFVVHDLLEISMYQINSSKSNSTVERKCMLKCIIGSKSIKQSNGNWYRNS